MNISQAVRQRLAELRQQRGLTINRLSDISGVTQSTVNDIVKGKSYSTGIATIKKLCDGLGISIRDFFDSDIFDDIEQEIK